MSQRPLKKPPGYRDEKLPIQTPPYQSPNLQPTTFYPPYKKKKSNCCRNCCFCLCISTVLLALFLVAFGGIFYVWYNPKLPGFTIQSFELDKFNVTTYKNGPTVKTQLSIKVEFLNTNRKIKFVYDKISMLVISDGFNLGKQIIPGFVQETSDLTTVKFIVKGKQLVGEEDANKLTDEFQSQNLKLTIEIITGIGMLLNGWNTGTAGVKVTCGSTTLKQINNGVTPKCNVYMFQLLYLY